MGTLVNFSATTHFSQSTSTLGPASRGTMGGVSTLSLDSISFGAGEISDTQAMNIVLERAMEKLRAVVDDARAELGIPEGATIDTSAEATAQRIVEFALSKFEFYQENHPELSEDEARALFAEFIGGAIQQGIQEASDILIALNALNPDVETKIDTIGSIIQERLDAFALGDS